MSETPQRHSHSGPGDGGELPDSAAVDKTQVLSKVTSDTETLAAGSSTVSIKTGLTDNSRRLVVHERIDRPSSGGDDFGGFVPVDYKSGEWEFQATQDSAGQSTVEYAVFEVTE
jgi:hypothetical protein